jgi:hypothetical protein
MNLENLMYIYIYANKFNVEHNAKIMQWLKEYTHNDKLDE